jgi:hypothetical protein
MNNLVAGMYKKSKSLPCSRNVSAAPSPVHQTESVDIPRADSSTFDIGENNERAEESMDKHSMSLPSSPASMRPTEDLSGESLAQKKSTTPFKLASKERRMEDLAKNRGDVIEKEKESEEQKKSESAAEESKQKVSVQNMKA